MFISECSTAESSTARPGKSARRSRYRPVGACQPGVMIGQVSTPHWIARFPRAIRARPSAGP
jgi:hypothetical protein